MSKYTFRQIISISFQNLDQETIKMMLKNFNESSITKNEDQMIALIMIITELAIKNSKYFDEDNCIYIETEAKFLMVLLNYVVNNNKLKLLEIIVFGIFKLFHIDYIKSTKDFNQRPYFKLFLYIINLLKEETGNEEIYSQNKRTFYFNVIADVLKIMQPINYPAFANAWIELLSVDSFICFMLSSEEGEISKEQNLKYDKYLSLLIDLCKFLRVINDQNVNNFTIKYLLDSVYKLFYVLFTKYPEFISYYYYNLIIVLPPYDNMVQIKNMILSCSPREFEQLDPFFDDFKVDNLPDIKKNSVILFNVETSLSEYKYLDKIEAYINNSKNEKLFEDISSSLNDCENDTLNYESIFYFI
jgi:hypothetical protein